MLQGRDELEAAIGEGRPVVALRRRAAQLEAVAQPGQGGRLLRPPSARAVSDEALKAELEGRQLG